jgi:hypothetical protein
MRRIQLIFAALAIVIMAFGAMSGQAMADEDCDFRERGDRDDVVVCRDDGDREVFEVEDYDYDDYYFSPYYFSPYAFYGYDSYEDSEEYFDELEDELDEIEDFYEDLNDDDGYYHHYYDW